MARLAVREGLQRQSDHEQFGCPSVRRLLDVYWESETTSTFCTPALPSFVSHCGLGEDERKFTKSFTATRYGSSFFTYFSQKNQYWQKNQAYYKYTKKR